jgi:hypothetical protein
VVQAREAEFLRVEPGYPVLHIARRHRRAVLEADAQPERVPPGDVTAVRAAQREGKVRDDAGDVARCGVIKAVRLRWRKIRAKAWTSGSSSRWGSRWTTARRRDK